MKNIFFIVVILLSILVGCKERGTIQVSENSIRKLVDTIGFAQYPWQMDTLMSRLNRKVWKETKGNPWKLAICPHDDYTYVGTLYPEILQNIKATNLIILGVAHRAARIGIEDSLVFDNFNYWKGPWKAVKVSPARKEIFNLLRGRYAVVSDSLHEMEHSVESMIPFLQYFNEEITIVPILVPAMNQERMDECGKALADAIKKVADKHKWEWGKDYAIIVTTDAVHYGNEDWGGADMAYFGCDDAGNLKALAREKEIIDSCLAGRIEPVNFKLFSAYTLKPENYKEYKWTWCGRYCVPVALYTSYYLNGSKPLTGEFIGYSTSMTSEHIQVDDIRMGHTAIATACHWVGYAALGYR
jgi:AmmeMemoRadiSam system protein B